MFILRKLFFEGDNANEYNLILGDAYSTVTEHNKGWAKLDEDWGGSSEIYCFITYDGGSKVTPLYKKQGNYIMTSDGKTFSNLTHK